MKCTRKDCVYRLCNDDCLMRVDIGIASENVSCLFYRTDFPPLDELMPKVKRYTEENMEKFFNGSVQEEPTDEQLKRKIRRVLMQIERQRRRFGS